MHQGRAQDDPMTDQGAGTRGEGRTREQWIEWIDSACPHSPTIVLFRSGCADCWMETVAAAREQAQGEERERVVDMIRKFYGCYEHVYPKSTCAICFGRRATLDSIIDAITRPPGGACPITWVHVAHDACSGAGTPFIRPGGAPDEGAKG